MIGTSVVKKLNNVLRLFDPTILFLDWCVTHSVPGYIQKYQRPGKRMNNINKYFKYFATPLPYINTEMQRNLFKVTLKKLLMYLRKATFCEYNSSYLILVNEICTRMFMLCQ